MTADPALFGDHAAQWNVPRAGWKLRDFLEAIGQTQQPRRQGWSVALEGKSAIVIAAAHAQSPAMAVKADQGHEHQINAPDRLQYTADGLGNAESVAFQGGAGAAGNEIHPERRVVVQARQDDHFSALPRLGHERPGVDLAIGGMIEGDAAGGAPRGQALETLQDATIPKPVQSPR